ncbi:MAG TPA: hypothetical protein VLM39_08855, partial [Ignavibacteriaceae bacterium]|nr:hypothetical protein [Ignavibacteriaceae bacterium]
MKRGILFFLFITNQIVFTQVTIKERVEIEPQAITYFLNSINEHIFTYTLTWSPSSDRRGNIKIVLCTNDTLNSGWSTSGIATISFPANGRHIFLFEQERYCSRFNKLDWWYEELPNVVRKIYLDGIDLNLPPNQSGGNQNIYGFYQFRIDGGYCQSNEATFLIAPSANSSCNGQNWFITDPVNLQITEGAFYVSLYNKATGIDLGNSAQVAYDDVKNVILKRIEPEPPVTTITRITIEANINGIINTQSTVFFPLNFVIRIPSSPDTMVAGSSGKIEIEVYHNCRSLPAEIKVNAEIIKGQEYGNLINPAKGEESKILTNLEHQWGDLYLDYIADGKRLGETDTVIIRISTTDTKIINKDLTI